MKLKDVVVSLAIIGAILGSFYGWGFYKSGVKRKVNEIRIVDNQWLVSETEFTYNFNPGWSENKQELFLYKIFKGNLRLYDKDGDNLVDRVSRKRYGLSEDYDRGEKGTEKLFEKADVLFAKKKQELNVEERLKQLQTPANPEHILDDFFY